MKRLFLVILGFLFFTLIFTYPAFNHLSDKIIGDGGDNYQFLSFQYLANREFSQGQFPFGWTNYWRYPVGFDLSVSYDSTLLLLLGIFLYQIFTNPVVVYNFSVFILLFFNCFLSYLFFAQVTKNKLLGFVGGLIYGFSFYNLARVGGHTNLILTGCFPFFLYGLLLIFRRRGDNLSFAVLASSLILIFLTSLQYLLIFAASLLFFIPLFCIFYKKETYFLLKLFWDKRLKTTLSILAVLSVFLFFNYGRISAFFSRSLILPVADIVSVPAINYFLPNVYLKTVLPSVFNTSKKWIEYTVFLGFAEFLLFLFFVFCGKTDKKIKSFLLVNIAVLVVISSPLPYSFLFKFLPFRGIIEPARFYIVWYLAATLGILLFLKYFFSETGKLGIAMIILFIAFERLPLNFYLSNTHYDKYFINAVVKSPSKAVLDLPVFIDWWNGNVYDLYSVYYQKPIVNGYIHWSGNTKETQVLTDRLNKFKCRNYEDFGNESQLNINEEEEKEENLILLRDLKGYGIKTIVFHKDLSLDKVECRQTNEKIRIFLEESAISFNKTFEDQKKAVYELVDD